MKKILIVCAGIVGVIVVAAIIVPFLVPTETWKTQIEQRTSAATGRKLVIAGPVRLSLLPTIAVVASDVSFANAPGARDGAMASFAKLEIRIRLLPLLSGKLAVDRFVLEKPVIHLEIDERGRPNWDLSNTATTTTPSSPSQKGSNASLSDIQLGNIQLSDGSITYLDARSGAHYEVSDVKAKLLFPGFDGPLKANGSFKWNDQDVAITGEITRPGAAMNGGESTVGFTIDAKPIHFIFGGKTNGAKPAMLTGDLALSVPNVRELATWLGQPITAPKSGLGPLDIKGTFFAQGPKISFTAASYKLDDIEATGDLTVDTGGRVPYVKAVLATSMMDFNPYLAQPKTGNKSANASSQPAPTPAARASQGWSNEPIDLSPIKTINADLSLTVGGLKYHDLNCGKSVLSIELKDGRLVADLPDLALYSGTGKAHLTIDGSTPTTTAALTTNLANIDIWPLLKDAMTLESIRGTANVDVTLATTGVSQRDLISALNGKGTALVKNGSVSGLDLGAMISNIGSAFSDAKSDKQQQTGFSDATATFTMTNGVLRNNDLSMEAPLFRANGKGNVDLPKRTINYRVEPKLVLDPRGQGGWKNAIGIGVPIDISGPWDKIDYSPDLLGMLPDVGGALQGLRNLFGP